MHATWAVCQVHVLEGGGGVGGVGGGGVGGIGGGGVGGAGGVGDAEK